MNTCRKPNNIVDINNRCRPKIITSTPRKVDIVSNEMHTQSKIQAATAVTLWLRLNRNGTAFSPRG